MGVQCPNSEQEINEAPLECLGLPDYSSPKSLIDALLSQGLPHLDVKDIRAVAQLSTGFRSAMEGQEIWRLTCAALAREAGLYAPASAEDWRSCESSTHPSH